jgi:hypothetical protein
LDEQVEPDLTVIHRRSSALKRGITSKERRILLHRISIISDFTRTPKGGKQSL